jgi:hypothetical protein
LIVCSLVRGVDESPPTVGISTELELRGKPSFKDARTGDGAPSKAISSLESGEIKPGASKARSKIAESCPDMSMRSAARVSPRPFGTVVLTDRA